MNWKTLMEQLSYANPICYQLLLCTNSNNITTQKGVLQLEKTLMGDIKELQQS